MRPALASIPDDATQADLWVWAWQLVGALETLSLPAWPLTDDDKRYMAKAAEVLRRLAGPEMPT